MFATMYNATADNATANNATANNATAATLRNVAAVLIPMTDNNTRFELSPR